MQMKSDAKHKILITLICSAVAVVIAFGIHFIVFEKNAEKNIKVGFVYVGDLSDAYTSNFA